MRGLYAIVDTDTLLRRGLDPLRFTTAVLSAKPAALQLRAKGMGARDTLSLLRDVVVLARQHDVPCFANDRPDIAALAGCDGVHLGQNDLPPIDARAVMAALGAPDARIGMSVHNGGELEVALAASPDYIAFGPVFATASKTAPEPTIGLAGLRQLTAAARARTTVPFVAIGGITAEHAAVVGEICPCMAVIGDLAADSSYDAIARRASAWSSSS